MKIIGIVVEYNPFHNGHLYQIQSLRERFHPDGIVVIMSGHFVQRGQPAIFDKWMRAEMALICGVDLVLELPFYDATSSAEGFADGAVRALAATGIVTHLAFGTECDDLTLLTKIARIYAEEPSHFKDQLSEHLKSGLPFAKAREKALQDAFPQFDDSQLTAVRKSNAILAIEYLKACYRHGLDLEPLPIKRIGSDYHNADLQENYASATAIRSILKAIPTPSRKQLMTVMPVSAVDCMMASGINRQLDINAFEPYIRYRLALMDAGALANIRGVSEGLEYKLAAASKNFTDLSDLIVQLKSKRYAETRLHRILINVLLDVHPLDTTATYLRVLGFTPTGQACLKAMKSMASRTIVTTLSKAPAEVLNDPHMKLDLLATDLYHMAAGQTKSGMDFTKPPIQIK
ncbi:nucleotidyltransferase [Fusibacter paucivorans]|uniref:tRNA(Met) cytidine acetate ligase n=1 Tax=Fusibacter paucivorans TaxID=76009 RepID=A0ABS5PQM6_9FIRM|nr:nucleotidyltransferase [Fusibacter paucivorans]